MRLDFFRKIIVQTLKYYPLVLNIPCVTYSLASITTHDLQTSKVRHIYTVNYVNAPSGNSSP